MALSKIDPDGLNVGQIGGRRNLIINGAMQVAQRGTSSTGVTSNGYYTCDRFKNYISGLGTWSISQSTDAPDGFASSLKLDCTTADASPASSDYLQVGHFIEGQDLQQLQFGSSGAKSLTLSFWVKSNKTGTGRVHFAQPDASYRSIGGSYTISAANTWEQKTITIVGDTSGTINNDNGIGLEIIWWLDSGSNYNSGAMPTAWEADSAADRNASGTLALGDSTANEWYITGVQLEVGNVATPFEHRSYGEELALCQRYYVKITSSASNDSFGMGVNEDTTRCFTHHAFPVPMRTDPTALETTGTATDYEIRKPGTTVTCSAVPEFVRASEYGSLLRFIVASGLTQGQGGQNRAANADAFLAWSAEL